MLSSEPDVPAVASSDGADAVRVRRSPESTISAPTSTTAALSSPSPPRSGAARAASLIARQSGESTSSASSKRSSGPAGWADLIASVEQHASTNTTPPPSVTGMMAPHSPPMGLRTASPKHHPSVAWSSHSGGSGGSAGTSPNSHLLANPIHRPAGYGGIDSFADDSLTNGNGMGPRRSSSVGLLRNHSGSALRPLMIHVGSPASVNGNGVGDDVRGSGALLLPHVPSNGYGATTSSGGAPIMTSYRRRSQVNLGGPNGIAANSNGNGNTNSNHGLSSPDHGGFGWCVPALGFWRHRIMVGFILASIMWIVWLFIEVETLSGGRKGHGGRGGGSRHIPGVCDAPRGVEGGVLEVSPLPGITHLNINFTGRQIGVVRLEPAWKGDGDLVRVKADLRVGDGVVVAGPGREDGFNYTADYRESVSGNRFEGSLVVSAGRFDSKDAVVGSSGCVVSYVTVLVPPRAFDGVIVTVAGAAVFVDADFTDGDLPWADGNTARAAAFGDLPPMEEEWDD
ncbi:hypothetical protein HK101_009634, partial [Irineochytrium annulatum]